MAEHLLSTSDNPWNPWTHHDQWYAWDMEAGYHTLSYLARIIVSSHEISQADQDLAYDLAVEEILQFNLTGNYIKVPEPSS
jgi:hypothetical protein